MKIEEASGGFAGLILRIDANGAPVQFDNMQNQRIQGRHDWKKYSITLPLPEDADKISVAGIISGTGKAWFDSFSILIDGKRLEEAKR